MLHLSQTNEKAMPVQNVPVGRPSCWAKVKYGFRLGCCIGLTFGALFGGLNALRLGIRGRELFSTLGKDMMSAGGKFGTIIAIGAGIRCWNWETSFRVLHGSSLFCRYSAQLDCHFKICTVLGSFAKPEEKWCFRNKQRFRAPSKTFSWLPSLSAG